MAGQATTDPSQISFAPENRVNEIEAAKYLARPVTTLRHWRLKGGGPRYLKAGKRVEYLRTDLDAF